MYVNHNTFTLAIGKSKDLLKPQENQPPAGESGRRAPPQACVAGDHSRAPHARKATVPCSLRRCWCGVRHQARAQRWRSETVEKHWKTKGETACAPGPSQAHWRLPEMGNSAPRWRCTAMREAQASSLEPHSGTQSSRCLRTHKKL